MAETKVNDEFHSYDNAIVDDRIYSVGKMIDMCYINRGPAYYERIGNEINLTSIQARIMIAPWKNNEGDVSATVISTFVLRVIIFSWLTDSIPTTDYLLQFNDYSVPQYNSVLSPLSTFYKSLRKIWYDKTSTHYTTTSGKWNTSQYIDIYIPIKQYRKVHYSNAEEEANAPATNKLYMLLCSNCILGDEFDPWPIYLTFRTNFKDV